MTRFSVMMALGFGLVFTLAGCQTNITDADIKTVKLAEVRELVSAQTSNPNSRAALFVYPRSSARFAQGHIPTSQNLKLPQFPERGTVDPELAAYRTIVVYGDDPADVAARAMTKRLMAIGYRRVRLFPGGLREWRGAGYRVEVLSEAGDGTEARR